MLKYKCLECEDVFPEKFCVSAEDLANKNGKSLDDKDYYVCPNCNCSDLEETEEEISDFYNN
jgi:DNA-directed RNA polymerase subunit RPC12/RpoP